MALPANITAQIVSLNAAFAAASPITSAPRPAVKALLANAQAVVASIDAALAAGAGGLDAFPTATDADMIVSAVVGLPQAAETQRDLSDARGLIGRVVSNLVQVVVVPLPVASPKFVATEAGTMQAAVLGDESGKAITTEDGGEILI